MGSELSKYQVGQTVYVRGLTDINSPYTKCKVIKKTSSGIITVQSEKVMRPFDQRRNPLCLMYPMLCRWSEK